MFASRAETTKPESKSAGGTLPRKYYRGSTRDMFEQLVVERRVPTDFPADYLNPRERALQRKLAVVKLMTNVKNGILPSTDELTSQLKDIDFKGIRNRFHSHDIRNIVRDLEATSHAMVRVLEEKNSDNLLQDVILDLGLASKDAAKAAKRTSGAAAPKSEEYGLAKLRENFMTVLQAISSSSNFRKSITEITDWISDVVGTEASTHLGNKETYKSGDKAKAAITQIPSNAVNKITKAIPDLTDPNSPEAKRELAMLCERLRLIVSDIRSDPNAEHSIKSLISTLQYWYSWSAQRGGEIGDTARQSQKSVALNNAKSNTMQMLARVAGGTSAQPIVDCLRTLFEQYRNDASEQQLADQWRKHWKWMMKLDPDDLHSDEFTDRTQDLLRRTRAMTDPNTKQAFQDLRREARIYMDAVQNDPAMSELTADLSQLSKHTTMADVEDPEERLRRLSALRSDFFMNIPALLEYIRYIPLPRIQSVTNVNEFALDNMVIDLEKFVPHRCGANMRSEYYPRASVINDIHAKHSATGANSEQFIDIELNGILCEAKDTIFYFKRKTGLMRIAEAGLVDVIIGGNGMDIGFTLRRLHSGERLSYRNVPTGLPKNIEQTNAPRTPSGRLLSGPSKSRSMSRYRIKREFEIGDVKCNIHSLKLKFHGTKRDMLNNMVAPFLSGVLRRKISAQIATQLKPMLEKADFALSKYGMPILRRSDVGKANGSGGMRRVSAMFKPSSKPSQGQQQQQQEESGGRDEARQNVTGSAARGEKEGMEEKEDERERRRIRENEGGEDDISLPASGFGDEVEDLELAEMNPPNMAANPLNTTNTTTRPELLADAADPINIASTRPTTLAGGLSSTANPPAGIDTTTTTKPPAPATFANAANPDRGNSLNNTELGGRPPYIE